MTKEILGQVQNPAEKRLKNLDLEEMSLEEANKRIAGIYLNTSTEYMAEHRGDISLYHLYSKFTEKLPKYIPSVINK